MIDRDFTSAGDLFVLTPRFPPSVLACESTSRQCLCFIKFERETDDLCSPSAKSSESQCGHCDRPQNSSSFRIGARTRGIGRYSPAPNMMGCEVGAGDPCSGSTVIANALASVRGGRGGLSTVALPCASGLNNPAGIGAPVVGINHSSYAFPGGKDGRFVARNTRLDRSRT